MEVKEIGKVREVVVHKESLSLRIYCKLIISSYLVYLVTGFVAVDV